MRHLRRLTWKVWALGAFALVVLAGVVVAQNIYGIRDDAGTTATQPVSGDAKPIRITTDATGRLWVNVAAGTLSLSSGTITSLTPPTAAAVASAIVANPPTVGIAAGTVTTLTPPTAAAIATAVDGATNQAAVAADLNELTAAPVAKTLTLVTKEVATSGTGLPLVASETFARKVVLMAKKATGANTGLVYIGTSTVDATSPQQIALAPGDSITIDPGLGCKVDLATIYVDCAAGNTDGVTGWYWPI